MPFQFSKRSHELLANVHPQLRLVAIRALQLSEVDFGITAGNRTVKEQAALYAKGRTAPGPKVTWTMNSRHIGGFAIDVAPYVNGKLEWDDNGKLGLWPKIAAAFKAAAKELNVPIVWGGDWKTTKDRPHFELSADQFPSKGGK